GLDLADLDGDGDEDIVVSLTDLQVIGPPQDDYDLVAVLFNDGAGDFSAAKHYAVGNNPRTVFLADLGEDANNDVDIITANEQTTSSVSVLYNDGFGNFSAATNYSLGIEPRALFVADLNGDGFNDTVTANKEDDNLTVLFNDGFGAFVNFTDISVGTGAWDVFLEDVTGDPAKDIIVLNKHDGMVEIQENDGSGDFSFRMMINIENSNSVYLVVGDADLDGHQDIMCSSMGDDLLTLMFYNTTTSSYQRIQRTVDGGPRSFVLADLDIGRPGRLNIATADVGGNSVTILMSDVPPTISILEPDGIDDTVEFEFRIEWEDYDPDSNANVHLYYFSSDDATLFVSLGGFFEDDHIDFLVWNVSSMDEGDYYIKAEISDDFNSMSVISDGPITVEFP
ncbi:MAG: VCBS repeat-containing protein, partial [Thermoplasmata archaeon]|nr:VCBS repeat-containing protein [Thermoplasmata archaeon]